jgi:hypothetical protein
MSKETAGYFRAEAIKYGLNEAIILQLIRECIKSGGAFGDDDMIRKNIKRFENKDWVSYTAKDISKEMPPFTPKQTRRALDILVSKGALLKNKFNQTNFDRTNWYALSDEVEV